MCSRTILKDTQRISGLLPLDKLQDTTVLVTGASGLIGTYLIACLSHFRGMGIRTRVYPLHFSEPPPHLTEIAANSGFDLLRVDLSDVDEYHKIPQADIIIHAAGYAQPSLFMSNPMATIQINTSATVALMRKLTAGGRFLFISSSEVYSGLNKAVLSESDIGLTAPSHPRAAYIEGKRCGEAICNVFSSHDLNVKIARIALAYGPGTRRHDGRALNSFIEKALIGNKIELMDTGSAVRTYCYIADIVELLWHILLHGNDTLYNVGGKSTVTISALARMIGTITGKPVTFPTTDKSSAGAPNEVRLDLSKIQTEFGKIDYIALEEGLKRTIAWQQQLYGREQAI